MAICTYDGTTTYQDVLKHFKDNGKGKTFVITGPSVGSLGAEAALALATTSPTAIYLLGRTASRIDPILTKIMTTSPSTTVEFVQLDTADNASVRACAEKLKPLLAKSSNGEIHGLLNSAGIIATKEFKLSKDGIEGQFATNHVGHFLLTNLLKEEILKGKGVVLQVSSGGFAISDSNFEDANFNDGKDYVPWIGYARSKAANALFAMALAKRLKGTDVLSLACTPGTVNDSALRKNNDLGDDRMMEAWQICQEIGLDLTAYGHQSTMDEGTANLILPLLDPSFRAHPGAYIEECHVNTRDEPLLTDENAEKLWAQSEELLGQTFTW
ncbi:short-chain dehydrogenase-like protein [Sarocladium strictum]